MRSFLHASALLVESMICNAYIMYIYIYIYIYIYTNMFYMHTYIYFMYMFVYIFYKLDLNTQATCNIYLKFFLCSATLRKWQCYEFIIYILLFRITNLLIY